jgi:hypothetical protein
VRIRFGVCTLIVMLSCVSAAQAAVFCATSGNELNIALEAAEFNGEDDTIKVATGVHITDYHAPGAYQWQYSPVFPFNYGQSADISGGWNGADNCQTQTTLDPSQTVLDARYWGPVWGSALSVETFTSSLKISNLTFTRGESSSAGGTGNSGMLILAAGGSVTIDNILVTGNRSGAANSKIAFFQMYEPGNIKVRNSQFLNNSLTHANSGGVGFWVNGGSVGQFTNNSISGNTATIANKGLDSIGIATLTNNASAGNTSTADPSYEFLSGAPTELTLKNNHFETVSIFNGVPFSEVNTTTGAPDWSLVGFRMVPDDVSPLRDSGDNAPLGEVPSIDFSGQPRIVNLIIDRGAVEADAPAGVTIGPLVEANSPANGSTTVLQGNIGEFVSTQLTFNVSGGVAGGFTKLECSVTAGAPDFGITSPGETITVGGSIVPIDAGFVLTSEVVNGQVTCEVTRDFAGITYLVYNFVGAPPGGPAIYDSSPKPNPDPASTIKLTGENGVIVGTEVLTKSLKVFNIADLGDSDMEVVCGPSGGSNPQITITPVVNGDLIQPQGSLEVIFDCDTSVPGNYFANYGCIYDLDDSQDTFTQDGAAFYRVECDVLPPPATEVEPTPASGTLTSEVVEPNGSANYDFSFAQISPDLDPPADANLLDCAIVDDTYGAFSIQSPAFPGGPYPILQGAPVAVQVQGSDNAGQQLYTATLHCEYSDTAHPCETASGVDDPAGPGAACGAADFPLELRVNSDAMFRVIKVFTDDTNGGPDNPTEVDVTLSCNTGLILTQTKTISQTSDVIFVVTSFDRGELSCEITEDTSTAELAGYTPTYTSGGPDGTDMDNDGGCNFHNLEGGSEFSCAIVNDADAVRIDIEKQWQVEGTGGDVVDQDYRLTLFCDAAIEDADQYCSLDSPASVVLPYQSCKNFDGNGPDDFTAWVTPEWPNSTCWVEETVYDDSVEIDNGCGNLQISHGEGDSCVITNTVFFEGIPTLSRWGMLATVLLMLGIGLVAFRRIA